MTQDNTDKHITLNDIAKAIYIYASGAHAEGLLHKTNWTFDHQIDYAVFLKHNEDELGVFIESPGLTLELSEYGINLGKGLQLEAVVELYNICQFYADKSVERAEDYEAKLKRLEEMVNSQSDPQPHYVVLTDANGLIAALEKECEKPCPLTPYYNGRVFMANRAHDDDIMVISNDKFLFECSVVLYDKFFKPASIDTPS